MRKRLTAALACAVLQACTSAGSPAPAAAPVVIPVAAAPDAVPTEALVPLAELRALAQAMPWECYNYDEASRTCEIVGRMTWRNERHGMARATFLLTEAPRVAAALSGPVWAEGDLDCGRMTEMTVEVAADAAVPEGATGKIEAAMRDELAKDGAVICSGVVRDGGHFRMIAYRDGKPFGVAMTMRLFAEPPPLRLADQVI